MTAPSKTRLTKTLTELEKKFWQSMVDEDTDVKLSDVDVAFPNDTTAILTYQVKQSVPARGKREHTVLEMNDRSTWIQADGRWRCVMHTETPAQPTKSLHDERARFIRARTDEMSFDRPTAVAFHSTNHFRRLIQAKAMGQQRVIPDGPK